MLQFLLIILPQTEPVILPLLSSNHRLHSPCVWVFRKLSIISLAVLFKISLNITLWSIILPLTELLAEKLLLLLLLLEALVLVVVVEQFEDSRADKDTGPLAENSWSWLSTGKIDSFILTFSFRNDSSLVVRLRTALKSASVISPTISSGFLPCHPLVFFFLLWPSIAKSSSFFFFGERSLFLGWFHFWRRSVQVFGLIKKYPAKIFQRVTAYRKLVGLYRQHNHTSRKLNFTAFIINFHHNFINTILSHFWQTITHFIITVL